MIFSPCIILNNLNVLKCGVRFSFKNIFLLTGLLESKETMKTLHIKIHITKTQM